MGWLINLKGKKFGRLKVIRRLKNNNRRETVWRCKCDCGNLCNILSRSLIHGVTKSCGCYHSDKVRKKPYYHLFSLIKRKCRSSKYNGKTCSFTFQEFLKFTKIKKCHYCAGKVIWWEHNSSGKNHQYNLDRKNNNIGYTKENCVVCCPRCNQMKKNLSYKEFYDFTLPIRLYKKQILC